MTEADSKCVALMPNEMYAPRTLPAIVAKEHVITACSSDLVIFAMYGRIRRGASACVTKAKYQIFMIQYV